MNDFWSNNLIISENVLHQQLDGETVLLNLDTEHYFGLDNIGTRIWQLLAQRVGPTAIVEHLLNEFDAPREQVRADVRRLVGELIAAGLVSLES